MGCHVETCFITGLPVREQDSVVMLVLDPAIQPRTADLIDDQHRVVSKYLRAVRCGRYDSYGWLFDMPLEEFEDVEFVTVFAHEAAWARVLATAPLPDDFEVFPPAWGNEADLREVLCVLLYCRSIRVSITRGVDYKGSRIDDADRFAEHAEYVAQLARQHRDARGRE